MTLRISEEDYYLAHYGILRRSGRYPWGSGGPEYASNQGFIDMVDAMRREGMSEPDIAKGLGTTTTALRAAKSIAKNEQKAADIATAQKYKEHGLSNVEIGKKMTPPRNESSVRALLADGANTKADRLQATADILKAHVDEKGFLDVGTGAEYFVNGGVSDTTLKTAVARLREEGYAMHNVQIEQLGTGGNMTVVKVLAPPGTKYTDIKNNLDQITSLTKYSEDGGKTWLNIDPPQSVSSKRVGITYKEEGGADADGVMYIRPGVKDLDLGQSRYAQVRIAVDGSHYIKGMAMYKDDLPPGVDIMFNTNKSNTGNKLDALKEMEKVKETGLVDMENPFGSVIRRQSGALNIVNEEGAWDDWSRNMSSQMLSKQSPKLASQQLAVTYENKKADLDEILSLTNPAVRRTLLESYADSADSSAVHLKAAALPRSFNRVILPIKNMKETEVYSPSHRDGERVVLIRYPHGGIFEIPELTVNNRHPGAKKALGPTKDNPQGAKDAIGIHPKTAEILSGADFDGDTVLVIPNNRGDVKTKSPLKELEGFDPKVRYPRYEGMELMDSRTKGVEMGQISNLITDMTIKGAPDHELARAVKHSMVVIDAEKHKLNYKQSAKDHGISALKKKYQTVPGRQGAGAATLISRATSREDVRARKRNYRIDPETGKKVWIETGESWVDAKGKTQYRTQRSQKLKETDDANTLSSGTTIEKTYADHSNRLKALANQARLEATRTQTIPYNQSAKKTFSAEVESLNSKLHLALQNRPRERHAQILANAQYKARRDANPDMDEAEEKKLKYQILKEARSRTGADKELVEITPREWEAIQAGAITNNKLMDILRNTDQDAVRQLAMPRTQLLMTDAKSSRAKAMVAQGYTQAEIADALGVSLTTLKTEL